MSLSLYESLLRIIIICCVGGDKYFGSLCVHIIGELEDCLYFVLLFCVIYIAVLVNGL